MVNRRLCGACVVVPSQLLPHRSVVQLWSLLWYCLVDTCIAMSSLVRISIGRACMCVDCVIMWCRVPLVRCNSTRLIPSWVQLVWLWCRCCCVFTARCCVCVCTDCDFNVTYDVWWWWCWTMWRHDDERYVNNDDDTSGVFCCQITMTTLCRHSSQMFIKPLVRRYQVSCA